MKVKKRDSLVDTALLSRYFFLFSDSLPITLHQKS